MYDGVGLYQPAKQEGGADDVGNHRCDGDSVDRHSQHDDEEQVQHNVEDSGHRQCLQRHFRVSDAPEDGGFKVIEEDGRQSQQVDSQIQERQRKDVVRDVEHIQQRCCDQLSDAHDQQTAAQGYDDGSVDCVVDRFIVASTDGIGDDYISSQGDP